MGRHGLVLGSLLTAVPVGLIHLPLAFESDGWAGTSWAQALVNWAFLLGALPFLRYLIGMLLADTGGSVLAAAMVHASFNAAGAMSPGDPRRLTAGARTCRPHPPPRPPPQAAASVGGIRTRRPPSTTTTTTTTKELP
jgi:hypothetical protein